MIDLVQQGLGPVARLPHGLFLFVANFLEPPALVDLFDGGGQQFEKFRARILDHIFIGAGAQRGERRSRVGIAGDIDDGRPRAARSQSLENGKTGLARKRMVERDDVHPAACDARHGVVAAGDGLDVMPARREPLRRENAQRFIVVDEQDVQRRTEFRSIGHFTPSPGPG